MDIYRENVGRDSRGQRFVRACAIEMQMDMSQEQFCMDNLQGKCQALPIPPRLNTYRKNPFSVATLFWEKKLLHTDSFQRELLDRQRLLHTDTFARRGFYR